MHNLKHFKQLSIKFPLAEEFRNKSIISLVHALTALTMDVIIMKHLKNIG